METSTKITRQRKDKKIRKTSKAKVREGIIGYMFMIPTIIGFSTFVVYPLISAIYYSLTRWNGLGKPKFIGLKNFEFMFTKDPAFLGSLKVTGLFVLMTVPTGLILGLFLAVLLNKKLPGVKLFRTIYYLPVVLPSVASLVLWKFIFNPQYGLANALLGALHLPTSKWLESEKMALPSMAIVMLWGVGSTVIILLSGLQSVPADIYEAAEVDGASDFRKFWTVTVPMITPVLFLQLITGIIASFQAFNLPQILTNYSGRGGGPNGATNLLAYSIYDTAFNSQDFGYAMAEVIILFLIITIFTVLIFRFSSAYVYYEADDAK